MNYQFLNIELNKLAKEVLILIGSDYSSTMSESQLQKLQQLINNENIVVIESSGDRYIEEKRKNNESDKIPLAHGGRTFGDEKIHFYPFVLNHFENVLGECKEVLVHEIFHYFIRPQNNMEKYQNITSYITEGIVDMYTRDFCKKYNQMGFDYKKGSEYGKNVIFAREMLAAISNDTSKDLAAFNYSIPELFQKSNEEYLLSKLENENNNNDPFYQLIQRIAVTISSEHSESLNRSLINYCANFENKQEMCDNLTGLIQQNYSNNNQCQMLGEELSSIIQQESSIKF